MLAILGRSWASTGGPGPLLGPLCAVLGRSWSLCWRSWAALGAYVGGLGPLLGPMLAVLGRSWALCGRSGAETCEERSYLENVLISRTGARSATLGVVLGRPHRHQVRPKTANKAPRAAQDRQHKPQEQPKTANMALRAGEDHPRGP